MTWQGAFNFAIGFATAAALVRWTNLGVYDFAFGFTACGCAIYFVDETIRYHESAP